MRAKSLKSSQILRAHMPYFRRLGHILGYFTNILGIFGFPAGLQIWNIVHAFEK